MRRTCTTFAGFAALAAAVAQQASSVPDIAIAQFGQTWYGPDGPWSAAEVEVGTPPQKVYLTVATLQDTILPITPDACNGIKACIDGRGSAYNQTSSSTWTPTADRDTELGADMSAGVIVNGQAYGIEVRGVPGQDTVSIGGIPGIRNVSVGAIRSTRINNGLLGLRNVTQQMYQQRLIPSPSWAYNTGSGDGSRLPQLVFGGYDRSKYLPGSVQNHTMIPVDNGRPTMKATLDYFFLNITGPTDRRSFKTNSSLIDEPLEVTIDSSTPYCWLPRAITDKIAQSVGAVWNESIGGSGYYVYNLSAPAYKNLETSTLAFHFNGTGDSWLFNSMTVSHWLFLAAPTEGVDPASPLRYLPLRPVDNASRSVLGRAFLQQIYLTANYYTNTFSMAQIDLDSQSAAQYVRVEAPVPPPLPSPSPPSSNKLSDGAIAGIAIGVVAFVAIILGLIFWQAKKRRKVGPHHRFIELLAADQPVPTPPDADKVYPKNGVYYRELSADAMGGQGRMVPPVELYAPNYPVEVSADTGEISK
ncbi:hypothetical protein TWF970_009996 [Orbilia oligospora]|uniref:Peptidase A1 domain-containing protein n=1 Tax=Orbilia oligospora TaxID=2813651 RepID=A0A7C8R7L4_ORBOL|nr:hypothetical protein TWF970_009996 [Orbilia oligospora]